jgi:hypothetical protein
MTRQDIKVPSREGEHFSLDHPIQTGSKTHQTPSPMGVFAPSIYRLLTSNFYEDKQEWNLFPVLL